MVPIVGSSPLTRGKLDQHTNHGHIRGLIPAHAGKTDKRPLAGHAPWAHPRSRGENRCACLGVRVVPGSSPLTRGKPQERRAPPEPLGLIPAHAGKTGLLLVGVFHEWAHPRSRGENRPRRWMRTSPPGLIPAHAGKTHPMSWRQISSGAHPRSRGENRSPSGVRVGFGGSSPLTRGKLLHQSPPGRDRGLIPAHAGKTSSSPTGSVRCGAHPRSRGENPDRILRAGHGAGSSPLTRGKPWSTVPWRARGGLIPAHAGKTSWKLKGKAIVSGSSPLTRGKPCVVITEASPLRLIPAHAGKTRPFTSRRLRCRAHPRSRGENYRSRSTSTTSAGSSPLTRGKPAQPCARRRAGGLIPAHAGKTVMPRTSARRSTAHPRSRGENPLHVSRRLSKSGSSPLTRGKRDLRRIERVAVGLIPAHAGKTYEAHALAIQTGAHPRSRGENVARVVTACLPAGSSPLTRGKLILPALALVDMGLIPAHAGKTWREILRLGWGRAHPRSRGENEGHAVALDWVTGSSPLTRGKPRRRPRSRQRPGLIPAHAGKTTRTCARFPSPWAHPRSRGENIVSTDQPRRGPGSSPLTRGKPRRRPRDRRRVGLIPAHAGKT